MQKRLIATFSLLLVVPLFAADKVENFTLPDLENRPVELQTLLKKGPVVLDFWATWCKPCLKAFPELEKLYLKYKDNGLTVVGVNEDGPRNQAKVGPFVKSLKVSFPILLDKNNELMRKLRVQALPTTFLIDTEGNVVVKHVGFSSNGIKQLDEEIARLVKQKGKNSR